MLGYWDEDKKNQEAFTPDRFYRTGLIMKKIQ
jgi:long-subunit acyl-CoA synthetase (AMP-forming)